jgi:spermidine/putrescine-binding protein
MISQLLNGLRKSSIVFFWMMVLIGFLLLPKGLSFLIKKRSLTIITWPLMLDSQYLKQFEKESGISLNIVYYDSSAALLNKLQASDGFDYDLIIADDHTVQLIIEKNLVKKIDQSKLLFKDQIDQSLLSHYYDPNNLFTLPYCWTYYGIGYDSDFLTQPKATWGLLLDPSLMPSRICMTDDPREALMIAAVYLFGSIDALKNPESLQKIKQLLREQKKRVEVYSIARADNLLQLKSCSVSAIMGNEIKRLSKEHGNIKFLMPEEGAFIVIDLFLISKASQKEDLIYQFFNYLYQEMVLDHHRNLFGYCYALKDEKQELCLEKPKKLDFFKNILSDTEINSFWIEIISS